MRSRFFPGLFAAISALFGAAGPVAAEFVPPRYVISAQVDAFRHRIRGRETVTWTNPTDRPAKEIVFHLYPNRRFTPPELNLFYRLAGYFKIDPFPEGYRAGRILVEEVRSAGRPAAFTVDREDGTLLRVALPTPVAPGGTVSVEMGFRVTVPHAVGRFGWHDGEMRLAYWYPILAVFDAGGWNTNPFYPFHRPFYNEAADYEVTLTVPEGVTVVHSGLRKEDRRTAEGRVLRIVSERPIREFTAVLAEGLERVVRSFDGIRIESYYRAGDRARAEEAAGAAADLMRFDTRLFGPYPYEAFRIVPVDLGYGGEQMSNLIFIDRRAYRLPGFLDRYFDFLVAHETGHQWFHNLVGVDAFREMWLEEGFNSYFLSEYLREKYGPEGEVIEWPHWIRGAARRLLPPLRFRRTRDFRYKLMARSGLDRPILGPLSGFQEPTSIFSITYGKGARVLGMLRTLIGEEAFGRVFRRIFREFAHRNLSVAAFRRLCEEESGRDLGAFFHDWLETAGRLDYTVRAVRDGDVLLGNNGTITMPVRVRLEFRDGSTREVTWSGSAGEARIALKPGERIRRVAIDPDERLLDVDRTNNLWPRRLEVEAVPLYVGLYEIPVFLSEDRYHFIVGPEWNRGGPGVKLSWQKPYDQIFYAGLDYEVGESLRHARVGYRLQHVGRRPLTLGVEVTDTHDLDGGDEDVTGGRLYLRHELWPAPYGLADLNDHVTLYLLRNVQLSGGEDFLTRGEDDRGVVYSRRNETITGVSLHLNRSGPYPDPVDGYRLSLFAEGAGHALGGTQSFSRVGADVGTYRRLGSIGVLAVRFKAGLGYPDDKGLFTLGGIDGLRGYHRKDLRGTDALLGSVEYRFPILRDLGITVADGLFGLEAVGGTIFVDAGRTWFASFDESPWYRDAGIGLRFTVNAASFLEKTVLRADVAWPIDDGGEDVKFWFGVSRLF